MKRKAKAVIFLSKSQACAIAKLHGTEAPEKPNQRVEMGEAKLWYMPKSSRKKSGAGRGKCFRISAENAGTLRPLLGVAMDSGRNAVLEYKVDDN